MPAVIVGKETPNPKFEAEDFTLIRSNTESILVDSDTRHLSILHATTSFTYKTNYIYLLDSINNTEKYRCLVITS